MRIRTAQGHLVETLELRGRSTPYDDIDRWTVFKVAVDGVLYPSFQIPTSQWEREKATLPELELWQNVADAALTQGDVDGLLQNRA